MAKQPASIYVCQNCGGQSRKWLGQCTECGEWNSLVEEIFRASSQIRSAAATVGGRLRAPEAIPFTEIEGQDDARFSTGIEEFDRVLGGGIVAGSLVLIGGSPGIGKSTIMLQMAEKLVSSGSSVLYISGEESEQQIKMRGERLGISGGGLLVLPETDLISVLSEAERLRPQVIIVDSIQTVASDKIESAPGSVSQVREVAGQLMLFAKHSGTPVFITGHITKDGAIAGPKTLEHIVDTVLYFEGDRHHNHRIIRATKNRFGTVNEIGVFEMTGSGLEPVSNPSELFLQERPKEATGSAVAVCMEGTRPMLVEVQALVSGSKFGTARRMTQGFDQNRTSLLIAVIEKRLGLQLAGDDVFLNVAGGLEIDEPAADLGVIAAIISSFRNLQIPPETAVFGEVGLTGEIRGVLQAEARAREAQTLGFKKLIIPESNKKGLERLLGVRVVGVRSLEDVIDHLFDRNE
ncbi:DNA repair protein RadA [Leptolyngbya sp. 7M]|uniref:DNA repair protein RadA n=1 Tax=Leptolyngbya sp. 7M TaxID=2812896 RepID=UPI001B8D53E5|nr:DNA repair protein RadA [Leptolyngbya sp. 7M]QYO65724.1 DNA repair protein RadA [Leptolyngbya sp. 7M]